MKRLYAMCLATSFFGCDGQTLVLGRAPVVADGGIAPRDAASAVQDAAMSAADGAQRENDEQDPGTEAEDFAPCLRDLDCIGQERSHCDLGRLECVECLVNSDCASGRLCASEEGTCEP